MEKGLENFRLREIIVIVFPGLYFASLLLPLNNSLDIVNFSNSIANNVSFIMFSLLIGIVFYWIDIPKRMSFFNRNLPTSKLINEHPAIEKYKIINSYFKFYDTISEEQRNKTNTYTNLYHFCVNIVLLSLVIIILYLIFPPFNYGYIALIIMIVAISNVFGLFYGNRKIKYMFERQFSAYKNSEAYTELTNPQS